MTRRRDTRECVGRSRPDGGPGAELGFTLVELIVTMSILAVVLASVTAFSLSVQRVARSNDQRLDDLAAARVGIDAVSKALRAGVRITATDPLVDVATDRRVVLHTAPRSRPAERVEFVIDADGRLVERRWVPDPAALPALQYVGAPRERTLSSAVDMAGGAVFSYLDLDGCAATPTTCPALDTTADSTTGLAASDLAIVDAIRIELRVRGEVNPPVRASVLTTTVLLRNESYVPEAS